MLCVPLRPSVPDQAPEAEQLVAFATDQVKVELPPLATVVGLALREILGGAVETVTVADCDAEPPAPVQASVYLVVAVSAAVLAEPLVASEPLQPPEAVHEVALVEDQVKVEVAPLLTVLGLAVRVTVGAGFVTVTVADWEALPPLPAQVTP